jgi:hypothetical protein
MVVGLTSVAWRHHVGMALERHDEWYVASLVTLAGSRHLKKQFSEI